MAVVTESEPPVDENIGDADECAPEADADGTDGADGGEGGAGADGGKPRAKKRMSNPRRATLLGLLVIVMLAALVGWFGYRAHQSQQAQAQRSQFIQVARQGALNLTTIDWQRADADVQRILDSATGEFYDDFDQRSKPFVDLVKQAKSASVGTVTEAGLESQTADSAQVLVAVTVTTSYVGQPQPDPHEWRMRISVQRVGDQDKVSNVEFVP
jgi:Mce-associated membrane protein